MKRIIFAIFILTLSLSLWAASLSIQIIDEYGNPLPGVRIILKGEKTYYGYSGESGTVYLNVEPGNYNVEAKLKGFTRKKLLEIKVLPGRNNFYRFSLPLGEKLLEEKAREVPSPSQIWHVASFEKQEIIPIEDDRPGSIVPESRSTFVWKDYTLSEDHFLFPAYPYLLELGDYAFTVNNFGETSIERAGTYKRIVSTGNELNLEGLPSSSFSRDPENPYYYSAYFTTTINAGDFKFTTAFSSFKEERNIAGFSNRVGKNGKLFYFEASRKGTGLRIMYTKTTQPYEIKYANFLYTADNVPSLEVKTRDFSIFSAKNEGDFVHSIFTGIRTWESNETISSEPGIINTRTGTKSLLGSNFTRMRDYYLKSSMGIFLDQMAGASHTIFAGAELNYLTLSSDFGVTNPILKYQYGDIPYFSPETDIRYWRVYGTGGTEHRGSKIRHFSIFLQDDWGFRKFHLFTGLRYDNYSSRYNSGIRNGRTGWDFINGEGYSDIFSRRVIYSFSGFSRESFGLRFGFSYELSKDFLLKGSLSRFGKPLNSREVMSYFPYVDGWADLFWTDINNDGAPSEDELNFYGIVPPPHTDQKAPTPYTDIISLGIEKALPYDFVFGLEGWVENSSSNIAMVNTSVDYFSEHPWWGSMEIPEPGPDGVFGTSDDGTITFYYFTPTEDKSEYTWSLTSVSIKDLDSSSKNLRIYFRRPLKNGFAFYLEGIYTKKKGYEGPTPIIYSPNQVENFKADYSRYFIRASLTLSPVKYTYASAYFLYDSGIPYQRSLYLITDKSYPFNFQKIIVSPKGYKTSNAFKTLNLSLSRIIKFGNYSATIYLKARDVFNWRSSLQQMDVQGLLTSEGKFYPMESFGKLLREWGGREFILGLRFNF